MPKFQNLSTAEKILLAEELWDSVLEGEASVPLSDKHRKILEERLKTYELDGEPGTPWDIVKQRVKEKSLQNTLG